MVESRLSSSLRRNIDALRRRRAEEEASANFEERVAHVITLGGHRRFPRGEIEALAQRQMGK